MSKYKIKVKDILEYLIYFFPISYILGNGIINFNLFLIFVFSLIFIFYYKKRIKFNPLLIATLILGIFISSLSLFTSSETLKSVLFLRYPIFSILIYNIFLYIKFDIKKLIYFYTLIISIISFDIIFQYLFKFNLIGIKPFYAWKNYINYNSFFGNTKIAGSFLVNYLFFFIVGVSFFFKGNKYSNIIISLFILFVLIAIFISQNRMSLVLALFGLILFCSFYRGKVIVVLTSILSFLAFFYFFPENNIKINYKNFLQNATEINIKSKLFSKHLQGVEYKEIKKNIPKTHKTDSEFYHLIGSGHAQLFVSSLSIIKENFLMGVGIKNYSFACNASKLKLKCSNHPHNYFLEILATSGVISFIILILIIYLVLKDFLKSKIFLKPRLNLNEQFYLILIINFIIIFFPFKSTGSFFTTGNASYIFFVIGLISYFQNIKYKK